MYRVHYVNDIINFVAQLDIKTCNLGLDGVSDDSVKDLFSEDPLDDSLVGQTCEALASLLDSVEFLLLLLFRLSTFFFFVV